MSGWVSQVERAVQNIFVEIDSAYLADRIAIQPPFETAIVDAIFGKIEPTALMIEQSGVGKIRSDSTTNLSQFSIPTVIQLGLNSTSGIGQVPDTAEMISSIIRNR